MRAACLALLLGLSGCAGGADPVDSGQAVTDSGGPTDPFCDGAPVTTWENFGHGFVLERCQACHATTTLERNGAPENIFFDTADDVAANADRILARAAAEEPTMPPSGGVPEDERYRLEVWLRCGS